MHTHTHTCIYVYINISIHICTYIVHTPTLFLRLKLSSCFALVMPAAPVNSPSAAFCGELLIGRFLMYGSYSYSRWNHRTRWTHACLTWVRNWLSSKNRRWGFFVRPWVWSWAERPLCHFLPPRPRNDSLSTWANHAASVLPGSTVSRCARPPWVDLKCILSRERLRQEKTDQLSRVKVGQNYHQVTSETGACCVVTDEFGLRDTSELEVNDRQSLGWLHLSHWYRYSHGGLQCVCEGLLVLLYLWGL